MKLVIPVTMRSVATLLCLFTGVAFAATPFEDRLSHIQQQWAVANYQITTPKEKLQAFESLADDAHRFSADNPNRAEPLIWEGIVLSTYAGAKGGLGALSLAKKSRVLLEA